MLETTAQVSAAAAAAAAGGRAADNQPAEDSAARAHGTSELGGSGSGESFLRVQWVAVPQALRARRANRRRQRRRRCQPARRGGGATHPRAKPRRHAGAHDDGLSIHQPTHATRRCRLLGRSGCRPLGTATQ
jgi:hypothetical protein